ncbi:carbohydrate kinase family protein [Tessaracoccus antarcticus]|uniref:Carbohydrate kinase n=1 Tax=Tessaracoccus antarcticus TaxID=2479848 RepID=A0A3M0GRL3_9ACTN|nr:carbohydrate kinase [Tessaracoccus antarcticus]RMB59916.1 carbohydrate kinase [Tessaracoccus antarcticus]
MRFVVCGEALVDMLPAEVVSPAETRWTALAGGGPMNTAVALTRLGEDVQFLGRLGGDAFGRQIERWLDANEVGTELMVRTDQATSMAVVSLDDDGKAQYTFHFDGTSNFGWRPSELPALSEDDWLHFGSIAAVVGPGAKPLLDFVAATPATVSYDINVRPSVQPDRSAYFHHVADLMAAVGSGGGIVKASDEDINWLVDDDDPLSYAEAWAAEYGLSMFVVTLGADGVAAVKPDGRHARVPGYQVELVDTVGAGDTFMAGFLSAYADDPMDVEAALTRGAAAAALVCSRKGANPPTSAELEAFLAR